MSLRKTSPWLAVLLASLSFCATAQQPVQQTYPAKPIRVVIPVVAGGPFDFLGRTLFQKLPSDISMVIDNRPGAGTALGTEVVAKSTPDGYTMLLTSSTHASLPVLYKSLPYDAVKDFIPALIIADNVGFLMAVQPNAPRTLREFIAIAKAQPGKFTYGSAGIGNASHLAAEIFDWVTGVQTTHIPYKGVVQLMPDLFSGRIDYSMGPPTAFLQHIRAGKLRALGIAAMNRWSELPDVPTMTEAGAKGVVFAPWYGIWFPAGTPEQHVTRIRSEMLRALQHPDVKRVYTLEGFIPGNGALSPAEITKKIADEIESNRRLAARIGLKAE